MADSDAGITLIARYLGLQEEWKKETERGLALTAAAFLDDILNELIQSLLLQNKGAEQLFHGSNPPLGNFGTRISAAFALGLISENEYRRVHLVRKVRNIFAHSVKASFAQPPVSNLSRELSKLTGAHLRTSSSAAEFPKEEFGWNAVFIINALIRRPTFVARHRLEHRDWIGMTYERFGFP
jgi:mannitol operon repressor